MVRFFDLYTEKVIFFTEYALFAIEHVIVYLIEINGEKY